ncbi:hypothetical protein Spb1_01350 [Planctopirus ephydatiae]|uniref:Uncharacterized protein n=1 Tax=Planctopirus ephydatiae TaxID=2528019 RepID=A0A518GI64_9PLAN|nr:hypothetical protein Spb1_01350 [Planctopirus ephydatiae]
MMTTCTTMTKTIVLHAGDGRLQMSQLDAAASYLRTEYDDWVSGVRYLRLTPGHEVQFVHGELPRKS